jgi:hypothetical protein
MCDVLFRQVSNAIEELFIVIESNTQQIAQMKSNIVYDLQKYHRDVWEKMEAFQHDFLYQMVRANLERGVKEGLYRPDFDVDIVSKLHVATSFQLFNETIFPQPNYKKEVVFREYLLHYMYGIASEKGLQLIQEKLAYHAK